MRNKIVILFILFLFPVIVQAQCAMCRAVLESSDSKAAAEGINQGILYLMVFPYLLMGGIAFFIYKAFKSKKKPLS
ncbi:MAG TPA: hypothetical protein VLN46_00295 [Gillisia sp.]|nr:hypothetical protein [Gillisia sp.]